jgi:hypothetical protein
MPVASVACFAAFAACSSAFSWMHASSSSRTSLSGMGGGAASKMQKPTTHRLLPLGATFTLWPVPVPVIMSISGALDVVGNIARDSSVDLKKTWTPPPLVRVRELCTQISIKATTALFPGR